MNIGVVIRAAASVTPTWTTAALIAAACRQGHLVWVVEVRDLGVDVHRVTGRAFRFPPDAASTPDAISTSLQRRTVRRSLIDMARLDLLMLRCAPLEPTLLALALRIEDAGVEVVNRPSALARVLSKAWLASHDLPTPRTLVTRSRGAAHLFHQDEGDIVVKPDRGSGGVGVRAVQKGDIVGLDDAFTHARQAGGLVVLQRRIQDPDGERRLVVCDGLLLGGYVRQNRDGEFRHNLKRGATPRPLTPDARDARIVQRLAPLLHDIGVRFAGLDVLGGRLVEVNAVNPGGTVHADALHGTRLADRVVRLLTRAERTEDGLPTPPDEETGRRPDRAR
jgi:glutathione synthase